MPARPLHLILAAAALMAALLAAPFAAAAAPPLPGNIDPALLKAALEDKTGSLRFIVEIRAQADLANLAIASGAGTQNQRAARGAAVVDALRQTATASQAPLLADLAAGLSAGRVRSYESLWVVNAVAVEADRDTLLAMAARPEVRFVRLDRWRQWVTDLPATDAEAGVAAGDVGWNIARVRADAVWAALGIDGTGVVVANIDTGVDWLHPALAAAYRGYHAGLPGHPHRQLARRHQRRLPVSRRRHGPRHPHHGHHGRRRRHRRGAGRALDRRKGLRQPGLRLR